MPVGLKMSAEIHDWLADLRDSDPPAALMVGQALIALAEEGDRLGPPLVVSVSDQPRPEDLLETLDTHYQAWLESTSVTRRRCADVATLKRNLERQITGLESQHATPEDRPDSPAARELIAELRRLLASASQAEERLAAVSQRQRAQVDAFRTRKEVLKARYATAQAEYLIAEATGQDTGDPGSPAAAAAATLREITGEIQRELGPQAPTEGLLDLRPASPGESGIRILFAFQPPGTALLIAVLDGRDAVHDHYRGAVMLSADVLQRARAGQAPEAVAHAFGDPGSFLDEFFPGRADEVSAGAAALVAANRVSPLADHRSRLGLTRAEVARRMGVPPERVASIERGEPGTTEIGILASYVEALGGRLDLIADFGGVRIVLR